MGLGLEKLWVGSFPGVAALRLENLLWWVRFQGLVALGTRVTHVCLCHTHSTAGQCPQQEDHVVRGKQTTDFLECLWAF